MTSKQLDILNRNNRIIDRLRRGEGQAGIARTEGLSAKQVNNIARRAGLRASAEDHRKSCIAGYYRNRPMDAFLSCDPEIAK